MTAPAHSGNGAGLPSTCDRKHSELRVQWRSDLDDYLGRAVAEASRAADAAVAAKHAAERTANAVSVVQQDVIWIKDGLDEVKHYAASLDQRVDLIAVQLAATTAEATGTHKALELNTKRWSTSMQVSGAILIAVIGAIASNADRIASWFGG